MIVLDTNVLSELMRPDGFERVFEWANTIRSDLLFTTAISQAEILYGLAIMPPGSKRDARIKAADGLFNEDFFGRVLPFDARAAEQFAAIAAGRRRAGLPIDGFDAQIAAIAGANEMSLATRDVSDFEDCGIDLINPWTI